MRQNGAADLGPDGHSLPVSPTGGAGGSRRSSSVIGDRSALRRSHRRDEPADEATKSASLRERPLEVFGDLRGLGSYNAHGEFLTAFEVDLGISMYWPEEAQPYYPWSLAWRDEDPSPATAALVRIARSLAVQNDWLTSSTSANAAAWLPPGNPARIEVIDDHADDHGLPVADASSRWGVTIATRTAALVGFMTANPSAAWVLVGMAVPSRYERVAPDRSARASCQMPSTTRPPSTNAHNGT